MNTDALSSPPLRQTSLPPSSAPLPSSNSNGLSQTPRRNRSTADALTFGDEDADEARAEDDVGARKRRRARGQGLNSDIPIVKDAVGESVQESFETFLKT